MTPSDMTLEEASRAYLDHLKAQGKHERTLYTYGKDCEQILAHFGAQKQISKILPVHVARFYRSDELLLITKSGKARSPITVQKTKRVLKQILQWAQAEGHLQTLPLPKAEQSHPKL